MIDRDQVLYALQNLQNTWDQQRIIVTGLDQRPQAADYTYTATAPCLIWPLQKTLCYATTDKHHKNGWAFYKLHSNEVFFFQHNQWMLRDSSKSYCLIKIEWFHECTLLTLNHNQEKIHISLPKIDNTILQLFKNDGTMGEYLACKSLIGLCLSQTQSQSHLKVSKSQLRFLACCDYLRERLDSDVTRSTLAQYMEMHPGHISRLFRQFYNGGYDAWLKHERIHRARQLLRDPNMSIEQCAQLCGLTNVSWFIRRFKELVGCTPGQYQAQLTYTSESV